MSKIFADFDLTQFWDLEYDWDRAPPLTDEIVAEVERDLGYKLPASYIELMRSQNGGFPLKTNHRIKESTSYSHDGITIIRFCSIGNVGTRSLCGLLGSEFWIKRWGYPPIGVYFAESYAAGYEMVCLDYRECGRTGEPPVVLIDREKDYKIVFVAKSFEAFIRGLEDDESVFEQDAESDATADGWA